MLKRIYQFSCISTPTQCTYQKITLNKGFYQIKAFGASGGDSSYSKYTNLGGRGGYAKGVLIVYKQTEFYLYIGGKGSYEYAKSSFGGWNGGGNSTAYGAGGGGATDIRTIPGNWDDNESLSSRIIVAGGGGGSYQGTYRHSDGGSGGGEPGGSTPIIKCGDENCSDIVYASPGTQKGCTGNAYSSCGSFGKGGSGNADWYAGGGGGYWGGSSSYRSSGGGSGYVGTLLFAKMKNGVNSGNGKIIIEQFSTGLTCNFNNRHFSFMPFLSLMIMS